MNSWNLFLSSRTPIYTSNDTGVSQKTEIFLNYERKTVLLSLISGSGFQPLHRPVNFALPQEFQLLSSSFPSPTRLKSEIRSKWWCQHYQAKLISSIRSDNLLQKSNSNWVNNSDFQIEKLSLFKKSLVFLPNFYLHKYFLYSELKKEQNLQKNSEWQT